MISVFLYGYYENKRYIKNGRRKKFGMILFMLDKSPAVS